MKFSGRIFACVCALALTAGAARAEVFHLKDGSWIAGVIVSFDQGSFTVRTNFGTAVIKRSEVARIVFEAPLRSRPTDPLVRKGFQYPLFWLRRGREQLQRPDWDAASMFTPIPLTRAHLATPWRPSATPPRPRRIHEIVEPNRYINLSFRFTLYKPPTWQSYPALIHPDTDMIAALGTQDETTLLLIGWEYFEGDNRTYARLAEQSLREVYESYDLISEGETRIAGRPAYQRRFGGLAEDRYWTGWTVYISRGNEHYTFLGLTSSEELSQVQEIVLRRVLDSLRFYRGLRVTVPTSTSTPAAE